MIDPFRDNRELDDGFAATVKANGKIFFDRADKVTIEILKGWYGNMTGREIQACITAIRKLRDINFPWYYEIVETLIDNHGDLFPSSAEASKTLDDLIAKGILRSSMETIGFGRNPPKEYQLLYLPQKVEDEILSAIAVENETSFDQFLCRPGDQDRSAGR